jgi:hypothetical protein
MSASFAAGGGMNGLLWQLARPSSDADRRRSRLVSYGVAGCGMFLLAAIAILTIDRENLSSGRLSDGTPLYRHNPAVEGLAPYLAQEGLRGGTALGAFLLAIPFVLFGLQALRTGTAARERRLAALSLAGTTGRQLRRLAFLEGTRAAVIGGLLAGPGYLLLWLVFGRLFPPGAEMLPTPGLAVVAGWSVLVVLLALAGGLAARLAARLATVSPLGMTRRGVRPLGPGNAVVPGLAVIALFLGLPMIWRFYIGELAGPVLLFLAVTLSLSAGPWLILITGRIADRGGLITMLAGRRLLADVRSPGRIAGVLFAVGIAFGVIGASIAGLLDGTSRGGDLSFYLTGDGAAALAGLVAAAVASSSLVVGANEQVLDGRRGTAVLVALAASPRVVCRVVRRQLLLASVPAAVLGALLGWLAFGGLTSGGPIHPTLSALSLPIALVVSGLAAALGALTAARAVRPSILASSTPDNLRAP